MLHIMIDVEHITNDIFARIRSKGKKLTRIRKAIIRMFNVPAHAILTATEIKSNLKASGLDVNKTTVYRELQFLLDNSIIGEVSVKTGVTHYESALYPHHHHITCNSCGDIKDIHTRELDNSMKKLEKKIKTQGFKVSEHTLEFYGLCSKCK